MHLIARNLNPMLRIWYSARSYKKKYSNTLNVFNYINFYHNQSNIVEQGVNILGHSLQKSISLARIDIKVWNFVCNLGYVCTKGGKKKFSIIPKILPFKV